MTDAYDELRKDWCDEGDMPSATCYHCGAHPGGPSLPPLERPWTFDGQPVKRRSGRSGREIFPTLPTPPADERKALRLGAAAPGHCACGAPTRDNAYGCDHHGGELERLFAEAPWIAEQLDATITRQRSAFAAGGTNPESLPWNDKASRVLNQLHAHMVTTVKTCHENRIRNQSPYPSLPSFKSIPAMSAWLLWRVDGLIYSDAFTGTLKKGLRIEADALLAIDRGPDLMYLGLCTARDDDGLCGGAIYARSGEDTGKCRACRAQYDVDARRGGLEKALDDMLCTASEIAHLATYLGLPASREQVRKLVNQWHVRGRITAGPGKGDPKFRYGDIAPLLAAKYPTDSKGA